MDAERFDALTTRLSAQLTRRRGLGVLAVLGLSGSSLAEDAEAKRKKRKKKGKQNTGNTPPDDGCGAGMHRCAGRCIPRSQCCTDAECSRENDEVCRDGTCTCPTGMIREFWGGCACPQGQRYCNGQCTVTECCADSHCMGNATCENNVCECHDACCRDTDCPGVETCENGQCACVPTDYRFCPEDPICPIGWKATTCTLRDGKDCCKRVFCSAGGTFGWWDSPDCYTDSCMPPSGIGVAGAQCNGGFQPCTTDAQCGPTGECVYVDCCNKSLCISRRA